MIVQASNDTGACYGVAKCAKIIFGREKIVKVVIKRFASAELKKMKTMDPDKDENYKFFGVKQADEIKMKVHNRVK